MTVFKTQYIKDHNRFEYNDDGIRDSVNLQYIGRFKAVRGAPLQLALFRKIVVKNGLFRASRVLRVFQKYFIQF